MGAVRAYFHKRNLGPGTSQSVRISRIGPSGTKSGYYVLVGCAVFAPRRWAIIGCLAMALLLGPEIMLLFPLWLAGAATYRVIGGIRRTHESFGWGLYLRSMILLLAFFCWLLYSPVGSAIGPMDVPRRYAVGVLFIIHLVGFKRVEHRLATLLHRGEKPIRWTAGMTFSLYLYHYPLLIFFAAVLPGAPSSVMHRIGLIWYPALGYSGNSSNHRAEKISMASRDRQRDFCGSCKYQPSRPVRNARLGARSHKFSLTVRRARRCRTETRSR